MPINNDNVDQVRIMNIAETPLKECFLIQPRVFRDHRGGFVKIYHANIFTKHGIRFELGETFYTVSQKNVLRGMHFQTPPHSQSKLVTCVSGAVMDVVVDLRSASPTYGKYYSCELNSDTCKTLFVPIGFAHGFLSLQDHSVIVYQTSSVHALEADETIRWNSFEFPWGISNPILSEKDRNAVPLSAYHSPF